MRSSWMVILLLCSAIAVADVRIDAYFEPDAGVVIGQRVRLIVEISTDTWFTTAPRYPELKLDGAIALLPDAFGVNFTQREGSTTWSGQRQRYVVFPQRVGKLVVAPFDVSLAVAADAKPGELQSVTTPEISLDAAMPPGADGVAEFVSTPRLRVDDSWDRALEELVVGDAVTRSIVQRADDTFALMLPAVSFADVDGASVYPATPALDDRSDRGRYSATRTDRATYVLQREGVVELPAVELHWFDVNRGRMVTETLEAVEFSVRANPNAIIDDGDATGVQREQRFGNTLRGAFDWIAANAHWLTLAVSLTWLLGMVWQRILVPWRNARAARRDARRRSEPEYFRKLLAARARGDSDEFVRCFWRWTDHLPGRKAPLALATLPRPRADERLAAWFHRMQAARYAKVPAAADLLGEIRPRDLERLRRQWLGRDRVRTARSLPSASSLNPRC